MAMSYSSLMGSKGSPGAIATWVAYNNIDTQTILDEAQALIYQSLRTREMRTVFTFGLSVGQCSVALPPYFLDPIGRVIDNNGVQYRHRSEAEIIDRRTYQAATGGTLGTNPFTSGAQYSSTLNVNIPNHGLTQGSDVTFPAGVPAVDGINIAGITFPVTAIIDTNNITITSPNEDQAATGNVTGGGTGVTWTGNMLNEATASVWSIFDEAIQFDCAIVQAIQCRLLCFRSKPLLSTSNPTNFLTSRYPQIIRVATNASAAAYMKDDDEEQKWLGKLSQLIEATNAESDLIYRGAEFGTETPGSSHFYGGL